MDLNFLEFEQARGIYAGFLRLRVNSYLKQGLNAEAFSDELAQILSTYRDGSCRLQLSYQGPGAGGTMVLGDEWRVQPTDELLRRLERLLGPGTLEVVYTRPVNPGEWRSPGAANSDAKPARPVAL